MALFLPAGELLLLGGGSVITAPYQPVYGLPEQFRA